MAHAIYLSAGLAGLWWVLSGYLLPLILVLGVLSIAFTLFICHRMNVMDSEGAPVFVTGRALAYYPWLLKEIVVANVDVCRAILSPATRVKPTVLRTRATQKTDLGHVIYGNSITLTPGTVAIGVEEGIITVHALTQAGAEGIASGEMDRRCTAIEGALGSEASGERLGGDGQ